MQNIEFEEKGAGIFTLVINNAPYGDFDVDCFKDIEFAKIALRDVFPNNLNVVFIEEIDLIQKWIITDHEGAKIGELRVDVTWDEMRFTPVNKEHEVAVFLNAQLDSNNFAYKSTLSYMDEGYSYEMALKRLKKDACDFINKGWDVRFYKEC